MSTSDVINRLLNQSRYRLDVLQSPAFLDVLRFEGEEQLSKPFEYIIHVTSTATDLTAEQLVLKPATFTMQAPVFDIAGVAEPVRAVHGVIQHFSRISTSADQTIYRLVLVPRVALLDHSAKCALYLNQSVQEVVEKVLRAHGLEGPDFEFQLSRSYPARELITQWRETDLAFIQRLLAEVGIYWHLEMDTRLEHDVIIFADSQQQYKFGVRLPLRNQAGMSDSGTESVWGLSTQHQVVTQQVSTRDYNYREALSPMDTTASAAGSDETTTGEVYQYAEPFLESGSEDGVETGAFYARLRHERILNAQKTVTGHSSCPHLAPGQVLEVDGTLPSVLNEGILLTGIKTYGSRKSRFTAQLTGQPYSETLCFRPVLPERPVIAGTLPARVESTTKADIYSWLDNQGRYRVKLDFDRDEQEQGYAYLWLRMAKPYAGDTYGWHAPLLDGTEVAIAFDSGDCDRPYIAYALHDSAHSDHVTDDNHTRNVLRTPSFNKLRMEDKRSEEHIKLATEFGKTQLNMGHLVDAERAQRGAGFEIRTDEHGVMRAGKGIFVSAEEQLKAQGKVLDMDPALGQIHQANNEMQALSDAATQATALASDIQKQLSFVDNRLTQLQSAAILASAPMGVALTSGEHLQLAARQNLMVNAGYNADVGVMKNLFIGAGEALSMFVHKQDATLIANQGQVTIQAQNNAMSLTARQTLTITSSDDEIIITTPKKLTLNGGGSYLTLEASKIEHGSSGDMTIKCTNYLVPMVGAVLGYHVPSFSKVNLSLNSPNNQSNLDEQNKQDSQNTGNPASE